MKGFDSFSAGLYGLLHERARLQKVVNYRKAVGAERAHRKRLMIKSIGLAGWEDLLIYYGGFSDGQLNAALKHLDQELEWRLCRRYIPG